MNIEEGNRLIALFMGCRLSGTNKVTCRGVKYTFPFNKNESKYISHLCYHSSWDWIMPVVLKIESLHVDFMPLYKVEILEYRCRIIDVYYRKVVFSSRIPGRKKIDNLFTVCVQFVNMWNELNKIL